MRVKVFYTENARQDLKELDKTVARRILLKIQFYTKEDNPLHHAKKLKNRLPTFTDTR